MTLRPTAYDSSAAQPARTRTRALRNACLGALALSAVAGCSGGTNKAKSGPCTRGELTGCGSACNDAKTCANGLFCANTGSCTAECAEASVARDCGSSAASCSADGHCIAAASDGSVLGDASLSGADGNAGGDGDQGGDGDSAGEGGVCGSVDVGAATVMPNVILIVDQSGSMTTAFGGTTRWDALKTALLADDGLIATLEDRVNFGLALYSASNDPNNFPQYQNECPVVTEVKVAPANLAAIRKVYQPADVIDDTPTGDAVQQILASINFLDSNVPTVFVLATDGEPDMCGELDPQTDEAKVKAIAAVKAAHDKGIRTYLIAVAEDTDTGISDGHAQDLANAGLGLVNPAAGKEAPFYRVTDTSALRTSLQTIVGGVLSCDLKLDGKVTLSLAEVCAHKDVSVQLNQTALTCQGKDGWELKDATHITVKGSACEALKKGNASLKATFPCGTVTVL